MKDLCYKVRFRCTECPNETPGSNQCFLTVFDWKVYWSVSTWRITSLFCFAVIILSMYCHCRSQDAFKIDKNAKMLLLLSNILPHSKFFVTLNHFNRTVWITMDVKTQFYMFYSFVSEEISLATELVARCYLLQ